MAISECPVLISRISYTTLTTADLYKPVHLTTAGYAHVGRNDTGGGNKPFGVCYGVTKTTSTRSEAIPIAIGGVAKVRMTASTAEAGELIGMSSDGYGCVPATTNFWVFGRIVEGTSGTTGQVVSAVIWPVPIRYTALLISTT